jgi:uncharacterized membrane protein YhfC
MPSEPVSPLVVLSGAGMIAVALGFVIVALWQGLGWRYLALGALMWIVTVAAKFAWAVPINSRVLVQLNAALPASLAGPVFYLYVGALTGVSEVFLTWLVVRSTRLRHATWPNVLAFGIGFGAIEALVLGVASLAGAIVALVMPERLPPEVVSQIAAGGRLAIALAPICERFFTVWIHLFTNVLIFYAVAARRPLWFWGAFWYKSLIDAIAAYWLLEFSRGGNAELKVWLIEAIAAAWGIVGWVGTFRMRPRYQQATRAEEIEPNARPSVE